MSLSKLLPFWHTSSAQKVGLLPLHGRGTLRLSCPRPPGPVLPPNDNKVSYALRGTLVYSLPLKGCMIVEEHNTQRFHNELFFMSDSTRDIQIQTKHAFPCLSFLPPLEHSLGLGQSLSGNPGSFFSPFPSHTWTLFQNIQCPLTPSDNFLLFLLPLTVSKVAMRHPFFYNLQSPLSGDP